MPPADPTQTLKQFTAALEHLGISYAVGGSVASSLYGIPRATNDVDVVVELGAAAIPPFVSALEADFYVDADMVRDAVSRHSSFNIIHKETFDKVDVFIARHEPVNRQQLSRRRRVMLGETSTGFEVDVTAPEDTILAKLEWYEKGNRVSDRQWTDIVGVLRVQGTALDLTYLRHWASVTGRSDLLAKAMREAGIATDL